MNEDKIKALGELARRTRKEQGLTQRQLAVASDVGIRFVRELEQGKPSCHIGKALYVLAMLGIEVQLDGKPL